MTNYPEIESKGFAEFRRGQSNPYAASTDHFRAWESGAKQAVLFDAGIDTEALNAA